ncbi:MAG: NAD(P)-binding domain-containing protein, partial [Terriglobia bacterium]
MTINEPRPATFEASTTFRSKLPSKTAQIGVIGLGYVGLPLGLLFARNGFPTTGFDIDQAKVDMLEKGGSYIRHIPGPAIAEQIRRKRFHATADFPSLKEMDAIV